jgi:uncharacterized protein YuzE
MKITYDKEVDALYIRFKETTVTTKHVDAGVAIDYDADGNIAGIEILDAKRRINDSSIFRSVTLEEIGIAHSQPV